MFDTAMTNRLDKICQRHTAFASFEHLVDASRRYHPTIRYGAIGLSDKEREDLRLLADAYDLFQAARGDDRRAYRG